MNLSEALNAALPVLPSRQAKVEVPRLDPAIVARQQVEEGVAVMIIHRPGTSSLYHLSPEQWGLVELFDGERDFAGISEAYCEATGVRYGEDDIREFAHRLAEMDIWYKSPQEKNIALMQKLAEERSRHTAKKSKHGDIAHIQFSAWDPDPFLTIAHEKMKWAFSRWFTVLTLCSFAFMAYIFIDNWGAIGRDTVKYYTFTEKTLGDLAEFWVLFLVLGFFHESTHGLACKHFGGGVHRMGFHLIYLTPAFFVDVTEAWVYADRWQRMATIIAGIWVELIFCAGASVVWWGTAAGSFAHELAYKVMLITGVAVVIVNLNPLIKLDGYYFFSELFDIQDIKERSTAYVSALVKKHVWGLPVEVEFVPRRLRRYFIPYALLSGMYSYMLLIFASLFVRNVCARFFGEWAFVPALLAAYFIFRARIRTLVRFMNDVYLDKREALRRWLRTPAAAAAGVALAVLLFAPLWRESVESRFVLEPATRQVLRAAVPGTIVAVHGSEGEAVSAGAPVVEMRNLDLESAWGRRSAELRSAQLAAAHAQLTYASFGASEQQRLQASVNYDIATQQVGKLTLRSAIDGVLLTPRLQDRVGSYVTSGTKLAEVADLSTMRARIYVPEFSMRELHVRAPASLFVDSLGSARHGTVDSISPVAAEAAAGLFHQVDYKGIRPPKYYDVSLSLPNPGGQLRDGMAGTAKIFVERRSLVGMGLRLVRDFSSRKIW